MKFTLSESYENPTVEEVIEILQNALDKLKGYSSHMPINLESNTYILKGCTYLSIPGRGFLDLDNPVEDDYDEYADGETFGEKLADWLDKTPSDDFAFIRVSSYLDKLEQEHNEDFEPIENLIDFIDNRASFEELEKLSSMAGISYVD